MLGRPLRFPVTTTLKVVGLPAVVASVRREVAALLREAADDEPLEAVARRLRELADLFDQ
jgi:hypothetical protein